VSTIRKAVLAAGFTFAGVLGGSMLDGNVTGPDLVIAAGMGLIAGAATYRVPNAPSQRELDDLA
jgi:hypothetical protein